MRFGWSLPDDAAIAIGSVEAVSDHEWRVPISEKATGKPLGALRIGAESTGTVVVKTITTAASAPPPAPPRSAAPVDEPAAPGGPSAYPRAVHQGGPRPARRTRRQRRERRHRPT